MIYQIQAQVATDAATQKALEQKLNPQIALRRQENLLAFQQYIPTLFQQFREHTPQRFGYFVTAAGQLNLVDLSTGITFYGVQAESEATQDAMTYSGNATRFDIASGDTEKKPLSVSSNNQKQALVVFGLGSGIALEHLLNTYHFDVVVVYEPEADVFDASLACCDWASMLTRAAQQSTQLFLQIGQAAMSPADDLSELTAHLNLEQLWLYRHTHHDFLDAWLAYLTSDAYRFEKVTNRTYKLSDFKGIEHQLPYYSPQASHEQASDKVLVGSKNVKQKAMRLFKKNWQALQDFYPELHEQLTDYQPRNWQLVADAETDDFNLYHRNRQGFWYPAEPKATSLDNLERYQHHAQANDLAISYRGGKLHRYEHFKYSQRLGEILEAHGVEKQELPASIPAMAIFMPALGYQLSSLLDTCQIQALYVVEPNIDFFYLSLYTVPWHKIFKDFKARDGSIHFSIGDDGSYLEQDMINRFSEGDGYLTANTYFYLPTPVLQLQTALNNLRREMKSLLVWAEYFDHVRYALAHNRINFLKGTPLLDHKALQKHQAEEQTLNTPVFIVGNGPSLDESIEYLQSIREQVLVMSCGTALKALHSYGIVPDFHVELEQNRVPYDIITALNDGDYLKKITLLTITTVHPDVVALFKDTWTAFKHGDGSAIVYQTIARQLNIEIASVHYAFPTVSNLALNFALLFGFRQIYFMGVDLGYVSLDKHHSKNSIYYSNKENKELYNYKKKVSGHTQVRGNLQPIVETQFQFKASADLMSRLLREMPHSEVYNCSNGMFITGTVPLKPEHIILEQGLAEPTKSYDYIRDTLFSKALAKNMQHAFDTRFETAQLVHELRLLLRTLKSPVTDEASALALIKEQQGILTLSFQARKSLLFPLLASELHLTHATLIRFLYAGETPEQGVELFKRGLEEWERTTAKVMANYLLEPMRCDETVWGRKAHL